MTQHEFAAELKRPEGVGTWTYLDIPFDLAAESGGKGQVKVKGTIGGQPFRSMALPHGNGWHYLVVNKPLRDAISVTQGDIVKVVMMVDNEPRQVSVPADLLGALKVNPEAKATFEGYPYYHQKEYLDWVEDAKKSETRQRRIAKVIAALLQKNSEQL